MITNQNRFQLNLTNQKVYRYIRLRAKRHPGVFRTLSFAFLLGSDLNQRRLLAFFSGVGPCLFDFPRHVSAYNHKKNVLPPIMSLHTGWSSPLPVNFVHFWNSGVCFRALSVFCFFRNFWGFDPYFRIFWIPFPPHTHTSASSDTFLIFFLFFF